MVAHWQLVEGVRREMEAVRKGFETIINISDLASFTPDEVTQTDNDISGHCLYFGFVFSKRYRYSCGLSVNRLKGAHSKGLLRFTALL